LEALGEREQAISEYRAVLRVEPDHIEARNNLGAALLSQGLAAEAIRHFRRVLALQPARAEAHFNLGLNLTRLGRTEEAAEALQQAIRIRPGYPEAHDNLGSAFALAGKADRAMRHFQEAARLRTDWAPPLLHMAQLLTTFPDENIRDGERAVRYAEQAAELTQYQDADVLDVLAASYAEQGRFPEAVRTAQRALLLYQQAGVTGAATALRRRAKSYENRLSDQRP
jgi:tetratricopeptide (TPR) repeat protein